MALSKDYRLREAATVGRVARLRPGAMNELGSLRIERSDSIQRKCAVVVPKKSVPLATRRNALRRSVTGQLMVLMPATIPGWRGVITLRGATEFSPSETRACLLELFKKSGIVQQ